MCAAKWPSPAGTIWSWSRGSTRTGIAVCIAGRRAFEDGCLRGEAGETGVHEVVFFTGKTAEHGMAIRASAWAEETVDRIDTGQSPLILSVV